MRRAIAARCREGEPPAAPAAALLVLFESGGLRGPNAAAGEVHVVLTRRSVALPTHPGEIALPGGRVHPGESMVDAALREAYEEVGIPPVDVEVVGWLDRVTGRSSGSVATPVVGLLANPPRLVPDPAEVERAFTPTLRELLRAYRQEVWDRPMHFFDLPDGVVWGMTARVLHQFLVVLTAT